MNPNTSTYTLRRSPHAASTKPRLLRGLLMTAALAPLAACMSPPVAPPASPFEQDVVEATDQLTNQWLAQQSLPLFLARMAPTTLVVGPFVNLPAETATPHAAQKPAFALPESIAAAKAKQIVASHLDAAAPEFKRVPAEVAADQPTALLLSASLAPKTTADSDAKVNTADQPKSEIPQLLTLVLLDSKTRNIVARWQGPVRTPAADMLPTKFSVDSPVIYNQGSMAINANTNVNTPTQLSPEEVAATATLGLISQGQDAYSAGQYEKALALFQKAATQPSSYAIRAYNGQYLSNLKLGREKDAKTAFQHVIAEGFKSQALAVKLLFTPGQTAFLADPAVSGAYSFWLQEISAQAATSAACINVSGHTSHTGEEMFNQRLSLARSQKVAELMQGNQPTLAPRLTATGKGWSENIVGSGTDDARDAIDRRVEFKIAPCAMPVKAG